MLFAAFYVAAGALSGASLWWSSRRQGFNRKVALTQSLAFGTVWPFSVPMWIVARLSKGDEHEIEAIHQDQELRGRSG